MLLGTTDFYHFIPRSLTSTLRMGSQSQRKVKPPAFVFSHTFQLIRMKLYLVLKQVKLNIVIILLSDTTFEREITAVSLIASIMLACIRTSMNQFDFKLVMSIDTIKPYILILVYPTLAFIRGHWSARKQKLLRQLSHKVFNRFE